MALPIRKSLLFLTTLCIVLAACSGESEDERNIEAEVESLTVIRPGAPGEPNQTLSPEDIAEIEQPEHNEADVAFARGMLDHHAQAVVMTGYVPERSDDPDVQLLAERMEVSQEDEIGQMEAWLRDRGELVRDPDSGHGDHGGATHDGMLTDEEMAQLEAATGAEFDALFLELMIKHHEGAVGMVEELYESGGGRDSEIDVIARHIESDQNIEIGRMQDMLTERDS